MIKIKLISAFILMISVSGCVTTKAQLYPITGNRAGGTVTVGYDTRDIYTDESDIDWRQAKGMAAKKCKAWGYKYAEPFGPVRTVCQRPGGFSGCAVGVKLIEYQCIGDLEE